MAEDMAAVDERPGLIERVGRRRGRPCGDRYLARSGVVVFLGPFFVDPLYLFVAQDELVVDRVAVDDDERHGLAFLDLEPGRFERAVFDGDVDHAPRSRSLGGTGSEDDQEEREGYDFQ